MNKPLPHDTPDSTEDARTRWQREYAAQIGTDRETRNRSGIAIQPLYSPLDVDPARYDADVGFPGQPPYTRGIYPTMHRGRTWTQRQLIGLGTPDDLQRAAARYPGPGRLGRVAHSLQLGVPRL